MQCVKSRGNDKQVPLDDEDIEHEIFFLWLLSEIKKFRSTKWMIV